MELNQALELLKNAVKYTGTIDQKHIDLSLVPTQDRPQYAKALVVAKLALESGAISKDELGRKLELE